MVYKYFLRLGCTHCCMAVDDLRPQLGFPFPERRSPSHVRPWWNTRKKRFFYQNQTLRLFPSSVGRHKRTPVLPQKKHRLCLLIMPITQIWRICSKEQSQRWGDRSLAMVVTPWTSSCACDWIWRQSEYLFSCFYQVFFVFYWIFQHSLCLIYCWIYQG